MLIATSRHRHRSLLMPMLPRWVLARPPFGLWPNDVIAASPRALAVCLDGGLRSQLPRRRLSSRPIHPLLSSFPTLTPTSTTLHASRLTNTFSSDSFRSSSPSLLDHPLIAARTLFLITAFAHHHPRTAYASRPTHQREAPPRSYQHNAAFSLLSRGRRRPT